MIINKRDEIKRPKILSMTNKIFTHTHTHTYTHTHTTPITHCIKYERRKFSSAINNIWNKLPPQLRNKNISINIFKKKLKKFLIAQH